MDTISVLVGFLVGVVAAAIAVELGLKKLFTPPSATHVTASWRLTEFEAPLVAAVDASETVYPKGADVVTAGGVAAEGFHGRQFRRNANARANFVVDRSRDRALLFMGPVAQGTLAVTTVDRELVGRLRAEHRRLWETGAAYVEEMPLAQVVGKVGLAVRTRGQVTEIVPYRDRHLLRLTDGRQSLGVLVDAPLDVLQQDVVVTGRLVRGTSGYTVLDADEVRLVRKASGPGRGDEREVAVPVPGGARTEISAPGVTPREAPKAPATERVLRVPPKARAKPEPEPEPEVAFEEVEEPLVSEAERRRAKAKVVLHR